MSIDQIRSTKKINGRVGEQFDWFDVLYQIVSVNRKEKEWVVLDMFTLRELIVR